MGGVALREFKHPKTAIYLLGSEDNGLPNEVRAQCQHIVSIESVNTASYNVAVAGSLVMYSRIFM
jgi:tRNA G18 (ribose-2'-O)-methylase SpoU